MAILPEPNARRGTELPTAIASNGRHRNLNFVLPGLGAVALAVGLLLVWKTGARQGAVYAVLGVSVAFFAAAIRQAWLRHAAADRAARNQPVQPASKEPAMASGAQPALAATTVPGLPAQSLAPPQPLPAVATVDKAGPPRDPGAVSAPSMAGAPQSKEPKEPQEPPAGAEPGPVHAASAAHPRARAPTDVQGLLDSTLADLLVAALLKDPQAVHRLRALLADVPEPVDAPRVNGSVAAPGSAA